MGQGLSCSATHENGLFSAVQCGDLEMVQLLLNNQPSLLHNTTLYDRQSPLHFAAANGQIEVCCCLFLSSLIWVSFSFVYLFWFIDWGF